MLEILDEDVIWGKVKSLQGEFTGRKVIVAYSGGVDSSVLAKLLSMVAAETLLVIQSGDSLGIGELGFAKAQAEQIGAQLKVIEYNEHELDENYRKNPENRCYFCKNLLHTALERLRNEMGFDVVVNGTNRSDLSGHRPGYQAVIERGAQTPLAKHGLTKAEIRWLARHYNMISKEKPASPCIASRIETGIPITRENLTLVKKSEHYLRSRYDFQILRMRYSHEGLRLELGERELKEWNDERTVNLKRWLLANGVRMKLTIDPTGYTPYVPPTARDLK